MAAPVRAGEGTFEVGAIQPLFQSRSMGSGFRYDAGHDGTRFLVTRPLAEDRSPLTIVLNWTETVRAR
jgi:hypothetical protein